MGKNAGGGNMIDQEKKIFVVDRCIRQFFLLVLYQTTNLKPYGGAFD